MIYEENELENEAIKNIVSMVVGAIKTAPKTKGINSLKTLVIIGNEKKDLAEEMRKFEPAYFKRDADNVLKSDAIILIGTRRVYLNFNCGLCGNNTCEENIKKGGYCYFNIIDLGIALGSAVSSLSIFKVDNRIMYTIGMAAKNLNLMGKGFDVIMGIPLKFERKNIFFDRK